MGFVSGDALHWPGGEAKGSMIMDNLDLPTIDYGRFGATTIDVRIMRDATAVLIGTGGGRLVAELLARSAIGTLIFIDPDAVDGTRNPLTQGHNWAEHGQPKVVVAARACREINPDVRTIPLSVAWNKACDENCELIASADILIACTDSYAVNRSVRRFGLARSIDVVEGWIYPNGDACEHVATFREVVNAGGGCGTCHLWMRHRAYQEGFKNPKDIPTYAIPSAYSSVQTAQLVISRLHQRAGSQLPIVGLAAQFQSRPAQITRLNPNFWAGANEPFGDVPAEYATFMTRAFDKDWPADWQCPDCGDLPKHAASERFELPVDRRFADCAGDAEQRTSTPNKESRT